MLSAQLNRGVFVSSPHKSEANSVRAVREADLKVRATPCAPVAERNRPAQDMHMIPMHVSVHLLAAHRAALCWQAYLSCLEPRRALAVLVTSTKGLHSSISIFCSCTFSMCCSIANSSCYNDGSLHIDICMPSGTDTTMEYIFDLFSISIPLVVVLMIVLDAFAPVCLLLTRAIKHRKEQYFISFRFLFFYCYSSWKFISR